MNEHAGDSISVWMATAQLPRFASLTANEQADVCIVGAGIAGLTTACLLGRAGKSVVVLDDGPIVSGETERTTAHLVTALDDRYFELERLHGEKGARLSVFRPEQNDFLFRAFNFDTVSFDVGVVLDGLM